MQLLIEYVCRNPSDLEGKHAFSIAPTVLKLLYRCRYTLGTTSRSSAQQTANYKMYKEISNGAAATGSNVIN